MEAASSGWRQADYITFTQAVADTGVGLGELVQAIQRGEVRIMPFGDLLLMRRADVEAVRAAGEPDAPS